MDSIQDAPSLSDFEWSNQAMAFTRNQEGRTCFFYLRTLKRSYGYQLEPSVGVRFDEVEKVFHRTSGFRREFQNVSPTIGCAVQRISDAIDLGKLKIGKREHIAAVASRLIEVFTTVAMPYYNKYSTLEAVDHALNNQPEQSTPHRIQVWLRAATGLIVARIQKREDYEYLVEEYRKQVAIQDRGFYLKRLEDLIEDLEVVSWPLHHGE